MEIVLIRLEIDSMWIVALFDLTRIVQNFVIFNLHGVCVHNVTMELLKHNFVIPNGENPVNVLASNVAYFRCWTQMMGMIQEY